MDLSVMPATAPLKGRTEN